MASRIFAIILFIPFCIGVGCKSYNVVGTYKIYGPMVFHELKVFPDSTFKFTIVGDLLTSHTEGKWTITNDTINFKSYQWYKPFDIVEEKIVKEHKDTVKLHFYHFDRTPITETVGVYSGSKDVYTSEGKVIFLKQDILNDSLTILHHYDISTFKLKHPDNNHLEIILSGNNRDFYYLESMLIKRRKLSLLDTKTFVYKKE